MPRKAAIITVFDPYTFKGGIEIYTIHLISLLKTKGIEITVYHTGLLNEDDSVRDITLGHKLIENVYHIGRRVLAEQDRYDLIISNSYYGMGYFPPMVKAFNIYHSTYAGYIQKFKDENIQNPYFYFQYLCEEMGEYISGYNRKKIAVSDAVKEELESIYGFTDVEVVCSGIDTGIFKRAENREYLRKRLKIPSDAFVGIFVGRWERMKNPNYVMRNIIAKRKDIYWLLVLGTGGDACELDSTTNVTIMREVPYKEMPMVYSTADFMIFPSAYEGFGLVIIEAMSCGVPVITTNVGIATKIYRQKPFDMLLIPDIHTVDEGDLTIVTDKIDILKNDNKLREEISQCGIIFVQEKFSLERWKREMERVLEV